MYFLLFICHQCIFLGKMFISLFIGVLVFFLLNYDSALYGPWLTPSLTQGHKDFSLTFPYRSFRLYIHFYICSPCWVNLGVTCELRVRIRFLHGHCFSTICRNSPLPRLMLLHFLKLTRLYLYRSVSGLFTLRHCAMLLRCCFQYVTQF